MKFEEILPSLRKGKRAKLKSNNEEPRWFEKGEWVADKRAYIHDGKKIEYISLSCVNEKNQWLGGVDSLNMPTWAIMCDYWELVE